MSWVIIGYQNNPGHYGIEKAYDICAREKNNMEVEYPNGSWRDGMEENGRTERRNECMTQTTWVGKRWTHHCTGWTL